MNCHKTTKAGTIEKIYDTIAYYSDACSALRHFYALAIGFLDNTVKISIKATYVTDPPHKFLFDRDFFVEHSVEVKCELQDQTIYAKDRYQIMDFLRFDNCALLAVENGAVWSGSNGRIICMIGDL